MKETVTLLHITEMFFITKSSDAESTMLKASEVSKRITFEGNLK